MGLGKLLGGLIKVAVREIKKDPTIIAEAVEAVKKVNQKEK